MKTPQFETLVLDKIVGGGQALGTLADGRKAFVWGGLPGERVTIAVTKRKSKFVEGIVTEVLESSLERVEPRDPDTYLSTSPWQIMSMSAEQHYKSALIEEAFELHDIVLPQAIEVYTNGVEYEYRNKAEFSWYGHIDELSGEERLDLAFFRRGTSGKVIIDNCSLMHPHIMRLAYQIRDYLQAKQVAARDLKTLLIRCDQAGNCVWQLYVKDRHFSSIHEVAAKDFDAQGGEVIYSDPKSPASRITKRLLAAGDTVLTDTIFGVPFRYATEGFFQVNLPVYEQALRDMGGELESLEVGKLESSEDTDKRVTRGGAAPTFSSAAGDVKEGADRVAGPASSDLRATAGGNDGSGDKRVIDLYSGVGSIGLTIGGDTVTLVEINEDAVREMRQNITMLGTNATAVLAPTEKALEYITADSVVIVDPPRAGIHHDVITRLLEVKPERIIYLSCNPVTQARDIALLASEYGIGKHRGYNFFPRTPHIEHLVILHRAKS